MYFHEGTPSVVVCRWVPTVPNIAPAGMSVKETFRARRVVLCSYRRGRSSMKETRGTVQEAHPRLSEGEKARLRCLPATPRKIAALLRGATSKKARMETGAGQVVRGRDSRPHGGLGAHVRLPDAPRARLKRDPDTRHSIRTSGRRTSSMTARIPGLRSTHTAPAGSTTSDSSGFLPPGMWSYYGMHEERGKETIARMTEMMAGHDLNHLRQIAEAPERKRRVNDSVPERVCPRPFRYISAMIERFNPAVPRHFLYANRRPPLDAGREGYSACAVHGLAWRISGPRDRLPRSARARHRGGRDTSSSLRESSGRTSRGSARLPDRACVFAFTAPRGYVMIALMMTAGISLRSSSTPPLLPLTPLHRHGGYPPDRQRRLLR